MPLKNGQSIINGICYMYFTTIFKNAFTIKPRLEIRMVIS